MRKWGIVISAFYLLILLGIIVPATVLIVEPFSRGSDFFREVWDTYHAWLFWIPAGVILVSQALLLFLSVDSSQKRLKPRAHILLSCAMAGILTALLSFAVIGSLGVAVRGDKFGEGWSANPFVFFVLFWLFWGIVFYVYLRNSSAPVTRITSWLLKGSVLELLIAVPCHVIVRRRHDCSAPAVTGFGIATGIAIMLLSFGPSVLFLYKKRLDSYPPHSSA